MSDKTCVRCCWFSLNPSCGNIGVCFDSYAERYDLYDNCVDSYMAVLSTDRACEDFKPKEAER